MRRRQVLKSPMTMRDDEGKLPRLNRYLASCGLGSRRKVEELLASGRVAVNGRLLFHPSYRVAKEDRVTLDGKPVRPKTQVYLVLNKPRGFLSAVSDRRLKTVVDLLPTRLRLLRPFPVGRLDLDSEGLLVLTNDGLFAQKLIHPSFGIPRTYEVLLDRPVLGADLERWREGVFLEERRLRPLKVRPLLREPSGHWLSLVLAEGIKREIRLMAFSLGFRVERLVRVAIGKLRLQNLGQGEFCELERADLWKRICHGGIV